MKASDFGSDKCHSFTTGGLTLRARSDGREQLDPCLRLGELSVHPAILICLVAATAVVGCVAVVVVPSFMTNDDPVMLLIAFGRLVSPAPDKHLLYTNVAVGAGLSWLYQYVATWPWYSLYLYACLCLAAGLTLASCLRWVPPKPIRCLTWILVPWILARFTMALHFTVVATWLPGASVAWCSSVCRGSASRTESWRAAVLGAGGVGLAELIRPEAAVLGALVAAPLLLWVFCLYSRPPGATRDGRVGDGNSHRARLHSCEQGLLCRLSGVGAVLSDQRGEDALR